jgi:hypothetical protein
VARRVARKALTVDRTAKEKAARNTVLMNNKLNLASDCSFNMNSNFICIFCSLSNSGTNYISWMLKCFLYDF